MKRFWLVGLACTALLAGRPGLCPAEDERLPDTAKLLAAYCCPASDQLSYGASIVTKVTIDDRFGLAGIEADTKLLDTPEEIVTAAYLSDRRVIAEVQGVLAAELPGGRIGALRLVAVWLKKSAEHPENAGSYRRAIDAIKDRQKLQEAEMKNFYIRALDRDIAAKAESCLGKWYPPPELRSAICTPLLDYYRNPAAETRARLIRAGGAAVNKSGDARDGYISLLAALDSSLAADIINGIHETQRRSVQSD